MSQLLRLRRPQMSRFMAVVAVLGVLLLGWPARPALGHAFLASSDPPANTVAPTAPQTVTLTFTEPLETSYSKATLYDASGAEVPGASSAIGSDPRIMTVQIPSGLANGTYSLLWRTLSTVDGHTAQGYLPFTVGTEADVRIVAAPATSDVSSALPQWALAVSRWLALLGLAAVSGLWLTWVAVARPAISPIWQLGPRITRRVRRLAVGAIAFSLLANVIALLVQAFSISGFSNPVSSVMTTLGQTRYGTWWLIRVGLLLVVAAVLLGVSWWRPWKHRAFTIAALVASAALPIPYAMISHAGAEPQGQQTAIAFDYVHLLGAVVWIGGLLTLVVALGPAVRDLTAEGRRVVLMRAIPRFSALALIAWGVLAVTGVYAGLLQVGNLTALTTTPYGQTLLLKLILIVPLLLLGAFNLLVVVRKLRGARTVERVEGWSGHFVTALLAELVVVTLLLGVVGMLIGTPPARQVLAQEAGSVRIPLSGDGQTGTLILTPGTVGQNHYRLELGAGHEAHLRNPSITEAVLRVDLPERQTGQLDVRLLPSPSGGFEAHGSELAFPGDWNLQVTVRVPGQADWVVSAQQPIGTTAPEANLPPPPPLFGPAGIGALALLVLGIAGLVLATLDKAPRFRKEAAGLGVVSIAVAAVLLLQAKLPPAEATSVATTPAAVQLAALDPVAVERGKDLFAQNCVACHGPGGKGDGPAAASMTVKPADLSAGHSLMHSDDDYAYWVENGIAGTEMPAFGDKLDQSQIRDVISYVRSLQQTALLARNAPGPEQCTVQPRTLDEITALAQTGAPQEAPPNATEPDGAPASPEEVAGVTDTIQEMVACSNAGDILRRLAVYSDNRIHFAYPDGPTAALKAIAANPLPVGEYERVAILSIADVQQLPDGRVSARVIVDNPANHSHDPNVSNANVQQEAARLIFVQENGRWRVDETRREETPINATPIPTGAGSGSTGGGGSGSATPTP
ncbi:MAG: copper resistance protein CopC [Thermomicrobiales bacterium]